MSSEPESIGVEVDGHLMVVTIKREAVRNALDPPACHEMATAFDRFAADDQLWVAIVTGAGDAAFCAGNDLRWQREHGLDPDAFPPSGFGGLTHREGLDKPVIAAVTGFALGGGFELALACDLVVADERASFGLPEPRVGTVAGAGGLVRLPRQVAPKRAAQLALTGRPVDARTLERWGVVNMVAPAGRSLEVARELAATVMEGAPLAVRAAKAMMAAGLRVPEEEALRARRPEQLELLETEDFREGAMAFTEKRAPVWKGR